MTDKQKSVYQLYFRELYVTAPLLLALTIVTFIYVLLKYGWKVYWLALPLADILYLLYYSRYFMLLFKAIKDVKMNLTETAVITVSASEYEKRMKLGNRFYTGRKKIAVTDTNGNRYRLAFWKSETPYLHSLNTLFPENIPYEIVYLQGSKLVVEIHPVIGSMSNEKEKEAYITMFLKFFGDTARI